MRNIFLITSLLLLIGNASAQIKSPSEYFGYDIGSKFHHHHQILEYFNYLESASEQIVLSEYGKTYEGRPLMMTILSSSRNLRELEIIRMDNLKRAKLEPGSTSTNVPIVWLSYNVHGNESSSSEASMVTAYELLNNEKFKKYLEDVVVIIDPCLNPDGRERYVHFYEQWGHLPYTPNGNDAAHHEFWPGGRANHYLFDLNRDWAWQTQIESEQRLAVYNKWLPQIHVDFHEQGVNDPYYFAPAAKPYHELISPFQRSFQKTIGKNHAKYFDQRGWLYFTKEVFDLVYPSYGDTYPMFNGAIGMTYEQGGSGYAGLGINIKGGEELTLKDRIAHHNTTGLSTVEISALNANELINQFSSYFNKATSETDKKYATYVIKNENRDKAEHLKNWLDKLDIQHGKASGVVSARGFHYQSSLSRNLTINSSDIVIPAAQPKSNLVQVLFEPSTYFEDSLTYDITAWSVPYFYGLDAYGLNTKVSIVASEKPDKPVNSPVEKKPYAIHIKWNSLQDVQFVSALLQKNINLRLLPSGGSYDGISIDEGLVATRVGNSNNYVNIILEVANEYGIKVTPIYTGFADLGIDLGSGSLEVLKTPSIAVLGGPGTSSLSFGEIRHFFEQVVEFPYTILRLDYFDKLNLDEFNILVMPSGYYQDLSDSQLQSIFSWVKKGGRLIAIDKALTKLSNSDFTSLKTYFDEKEEKSLSSNSTKNDALETSGSKGRAWISNYIPGAIFNLQLDNSHFLSTGLGGDYFSLKTSSDRYAYIKGGENVGTIKSKDDLQAGFVGSNLMNALEETLVIGRESVGKGDVVYLVDNPLFRSFWYEGKLLFSNSVFLKF